MISVWHNDSFVDYIIKGESALKDARVRLTAQVDTNDLNTAFEQTNHIDHDWTKNQSVIVICPGKKRSTSVGDIMITDKACFVVETAGFRELNKTEQSHLIFLNI